MDLPQRIFGSFCLTLFFILSTTAQEVPPDTKIAEGKYSVVGRLEDGSLTSNVYDEWSLWRQSDGRYRVESMLVLPADAPPPLPRIRSVWHYSADFQLEQMEAEIRRNGKHMRFACEMGDAEIHCTLRADEEGRHVVWAEGRSPAKRPYVLLPYRFIRASLVEVPWSYAAVVRSVGRELGEETKVDCYDFVEDKDSSKITLASDESVSVKYLGEETMTVAGKQFSTHKYEFGGTGAWEKRKVRVWVSGRGFLLAYEILGEPIRFELGEYRELQPFLLGPPR